MARQVSTSGFYRDYRKCKGCGKQFRIPGTAGRPPARCPECRAGRRSDDSEWRKVRAQVLREQPVCAVEGCQNPSTTVDHIIPLSKGGHRTARHNLQGMCGPHNFSKQDKLPVFQPDGEARPCKCKGAFHQGVACDTATTRGRRLCSVCEYFDCEDRNDAA